MSSITSLSPGVVSSASAIPAGTVQGAAALLVLKQAMQQQEANAAQLLEALPQTPRASEGSLGTQVDTYA
ncbi:putative motility protein [Inhella sp.]|uniref:putative motility protein n=1 Tax=Inhella sp. TaxID=1921806 RepID=UPI0035AFF74A